jgi:hypothetical protein
MFRPTSTELDVLEKINILQKDRRLVQAFFHKKEIGFFTG